MSDQMSRCIKINNWIFEVKTVRAIRVEEYGQPYSATANISLNGDKSYVDGLMTSSGNEFGRLDFDTFKSLLQQLGIKEAQFDRYKNNLAKQRTFDVPSLVEGQPLQLVSTA